jgi:hypothetical protein
MRLEERIGACREFVRKLEGKSRIVRSRRRWVNDIKIRKKSTGEGRREV